MLNTRIFLGRRWRREDAENRGASGDKIRFDVSLERSSHISASLSLIPSNQATAILTLHIMTTCGNRWGWKSIGNRRRYLPMMLLKNAQRIRERKNTTDSSYFLFFSWWLHPLSFPHCHWIKYQAKKMHKDLNYVRVMHQISMSSSILRKLSYLVIQVKQVQGHVSLIRHWTPHSMS